MNTKAVNRLIKEGSIATDVNFGLELKIKDSVFKPGIVRVHLPVPLNAEQLKEGQICDFDPVFRIVSVEDYPQRSAFFDEKLEKNRTFYIEMAFTNEMKYIAPNMELADNAKQKGFPKEQLEAYSAGEHCGCESYTVLARDAVGIMDLCSERYFEFTEVRRKVLNEIMVQGGTDFDSEKNGTKLKLIYDFCTSDEFEKVYKNCNESVNGEEKTVAGGSAGYVNGNGEFDRNIEFIALCRMAHIPARWQGGMYPDFENEKNEFLIKPGKCESLENAEGSENIYHDWACVYLAPYGWIFADCVCGTKYRDYRDYFLGNIDPYLIPTGTKFGGSLYPAKDYKRADELYNVRGEVELVAEDRGLKADEFETKLILIKQ